MSTPNKVIGWYMCSKKFISSPWEHILELSFICRWMWFSRLSCSILLLFSYAKLLRKCCWELFYRHGNCLLKQKLVCTVNKMCCKIDLYSNPGQTMIVFCPIDPGFSSLSYFGQPKKSIFFCFQDKCWWNTWEINFHWISFIRAIVFKNQHLHSCLSTCQVVWS